MKKALVLGGSSDIGSAIVKKLSFAGYVVHDTYYEHPGKLIHGLGEKVIHHECDLTLLSHVEAMIRHIGEVDLLVTAAFPFIESDNLDFDGYDKNEKFLRAHVFVICEVAKKMNKGGKVINLLGQCVDKGLAGGAFYSASYAFLHNLSMSINSQEGRQGQVSSHDLLLGPVDTSMWKGLSEDVLQRYKEKVLDFIEPEAVADAVLYIAESKIGPTKFKLDAFYSL